MNSLWRTFLTPCITISFPYHLPPPSTQLSLSSQFAFLSSALCFPCRHFYFHRLPSRSATRFTLVRPSSFITLVCTVYSLFPAFLSNHSGHPVLSLCPLSFHPANWSNEDEPETSGNIVYEMRKGVCGEAPEPRE